MTKDMARMIKRVIVVIKGRKHKLAALYMLWGDDQSVLKVLGVIR